MGDRQQRAEHASGCRALGQTERRADLGPGVTAEFVVDTDDQIGVVVADLSAVRTRQPVHEQCSQKQSPTGIQRMHAKSPCRGLGDNAGRGDSGGMTRQWDLEHQDQAEPSKFVALHRDWASTPGVVALHRLDEAGDPVDHGRGVEDDGG